MKKRFFLALIAFSMSLAGCGNDKDNGGDAGSGDGGIVNPNGGDNGGGNGSGGSGNSGNTGPLTEAQKEQATKAKEYLVELITKEYDEDTANAVSDHLDKYSEEFALKDGNVEKVKKYVTAYTPKEWKNGIADAIAYFANIGADEGLDDSVYFAVCYAKSYLRAESAFQAAEKAKAEETSDEKAIKEAAEEIAFWDATVTLMENEGDALPSNILGVANTLYNTYVKATLVATMKILPLIQAIMSQQKPTSGSVKNAFETIGGLINDATPVKSNVKYLADFAKKAALQLVPKAPDISEYSDIISSIIEFINFNKVIDAGFDVVEKLGTTLTSMPESYYTHIDATETNLECYIYMALGFVDKLVSKFDIASEDVSKVIADLITFVKGLYPKLNDKYKEIEYESKLSSMENKVKQFNTALAYNPQEFEGIENALYFLAEVGLFNPKKGLVPTLENTDYFWDKEHNKFLLAQRESKEKSYVGIYPEAYVGVEKTENWYSLNEFTPEALEDVEGIMGIPSFIGSIINSNNLKPIFDSLLNLVDIIRGLSLESLSIESIAKGVGCLSNYHNITVETTTSYKEVAGLEEGELDEEIAKLLNKTLDSYKTAREGSLEFTDNGSKASMSDLVTEEGETTFEVYNVSYSAYLDKDGNGTDEIKYSIAHVSYTTLQPLADFIYSVLGEIANGKAAITDKVIDGVVGVYQSIKALFNEIKPELPLDVETEENIEGVLAIADLLLGGADTDLFKTFVNQVFVALRDVFSAFIPANEETPADLDFSKILVKYLATEDISAIFLDVLFKVNPEKTAALKTLVGTAYTLMDDIGILDFVLEKLGLAYEKCDPQPNEATFNENPGTYFVIDEDGDYFVADAYDSEETYYVAVECTKDEFVDYISGFIAFIEQPAA